MIYGHFIENMGRFIYGGILQNERPGRITGPWQRREDLLETVKEIRPPVVRWPGGLYADGYDWRDGVGPRETRPLRRNRYWSRFGPFTRILDPHWFGTHEYMDFIRDLDTEPYINVNFGTGTASEAARWVEYVNGSTDTLEGSRRAEHGEPEPWGVRYWGIGNEMYAIWTLGHSGPREYAKRYLEYRQAMESVDPGLSYIAVGADVRFSETWNREVLSEAGDKIDLMSIHIYLPGTEHQLGFTAHHLRHGSAGLYAPIVAASVEIETRLRDAWKDVEDVLGPENDVVIALDEWNLWWKLSQLIVPRYTLRDALFVCGTFHALHRTSEFVKMANIAQLVNILGVLSARGQRFYRSPLFFAFKMYATLAGTLRVSTSTECGSFASPRLGGIRAMDDVPELDCSATLSADEGVLTLFVINRSVSDSVEVDIGIEGFSPKGDVEVQCLNGPSAEAMNWYGRDEVVSIEKSVRDAGDVLPRCRFPAHSATALVMER
jgi:alpha-N-arabinofuranosidase